MPYIIGNIIKENSPGMWGEKSAYEKKSLFKIDGSLPPVNYDEHIIRSHSLTHIESPLHVTKDGASVDQYFNKKSFCFWGKTHLLRLKGNKYEKRDGNISVWEITKDEIISALGELNTKPEDVQKIIITTDEYTKNQHGYHDPNKVLILSLEAAVFLSELPYLNLYGTSWKSSDYMPGSPERPIHKCLFKKAVILECLELSIVPQGVYFLTAFPLRIEGASESPVCPVLFEEHEIKF